MKKKITITLILSIFIVIYIYIANITLLPKNILLIQGEKLRFNTLIGINTANLNENKKTLEVTNLGTNSILHQTGKINLRLNLFNSIPLKDISVNVIPNIKVIPLGNAIGLKLYTDGVLIVGKSQIDGKKPYENTDIKEGDRIISIDDEKIDSTDELIDILNKSEGREINIKYISNDVEENVQVVPIKTKENEYKLGLWVRDASAGVGTATFYIPSSGMFACLGHGINDVDTEKIITISNGELVTTDIISIKKGEKGAPRRNKRKYRRSY